MNNGEAASGTLEKCVFLSTIRQTPRRAHHCCGIKAQHRRESCSTSITVEVSESKDRKEQVFINARTKTATTVQETTVRAGKLRKIGHNSERLRGHRLARVIVALKTDE